jgi:hypothetical protein
MESSYQQQKLGDGRVRFTVTPASIRKPGIGTVWMGALVGALIGGMSGPKQGFFSGVFVIVGAFLGYEAMARLMMFLARMKWGTRGGSFVVSDRGVETTAGALIPREHLHRFVLKNAFPALLEDRTVVVGGGLAAQFGADNVARGARYYKKVADISWSLCAEAGGRSTTLAGGMNDVTVYGLMADVSKLLAMQVT